MVVAKREALDRGWRSAASFRARHDCRDGLVELCAADVPPPQALSSIAAIASHNHGAAACAVGRRGSSNVLALYRGTDAVADDDDGKHRTSAAGLRLEMQGSLIALPGTPKAVSWSDDTLACGTLEGSIEIFRLDATARDAQTRARKVVHSLKPQWGASASSQQAAAGATSVAVGALDGRNARRIGAIVAASPCVWDGEASGLSVGMGFEAGAAFCLDLDWDKGVFVVGDLAHALAVYDPRQGTCVSKVKSAHFAPINTVRCSPLHPHWIASGSGDGLVKVWDLRRVDASLFRLAWHVSAVADVSWSWSHTDMLSSCAYDGSHLFWKLGLAPRFELANGDAVWQHAELVGCCMVPWAGSPLDCLVASSDGRLQRIRPSGNRIMQPFARLEAQRLAAMLPHPPPPSHAAPQATAAPQPPKVSAASVAAQHMRTNDMVAGALKVAAPAAVVRSCFLYLSFVHGIGGGRSCMLFVCVALARCNYGNRGAGLGLRMTCMHACMRANYRRLHACMRRSKWS